MATQVEDNLWGPTPGETYAIPIGSDDTPTEYEVRPGHPSPPGRTGRWVCLDHPEADVSNQLMKDGHITGYGGKRPGERHTLGWICFEHGELEVP
jgi:hypothetical protein